MTSRNNNNNNMIVTSLLLLLWIIRIGIQHSVILLLLLLLHFHYVTTFTILRIRTTPTPTTTTSISPSTPQRRQITYNIYDDRNNNSHKEEEDDDNDIPIQQEQLEQLIQEERTSYRRQVLRHLVVSLTVPLWQQSQQLDLSYAMDNNLPSSSTTTSSSLSSSGSTAILPLRSQSPSSIELPIGLLEGRVNENILSYPLYGMESSDIYYPQWFQGTWNVVSTTTDVLAPLGISLFGGNMTYENAVKEIGTSLQYESRFITTTSSTNGGVGSTTEEEQSMTVIADRGYNVQSIVLAALGPNSIIDIPYVSSNKLSAILSPKGAPNPIRVDLFTINRRQEYIDPTHFHCSEVVREIVSSIGTTTSSSSATNTLRSMSTILKEVETTTLYTLVQQGTKDRNSNNNKNNNNNVITAIRGRQRTAKYIVPTQNDASSFRLYELTRGKPIDVRYYDVLYTPKRKY